MFDPRLLKNVIKMVDVSYGGEAGFNQAIELSAETLGSVKLVQVCLIIVGQGQPRRCSFAALGRANRPGISSLGASKPSVDTSQWVLFVFFAFWECRVSLKLAEYK